MRDLAAVLDTTGWTWERYETLSFPSSTFWLGRDKEGNRWLTKLRGSFRAYREIVFDRLAQAMGWSCQSSAFLKLDVQSSITLGRNSGEVHDAHWFLQEHALSPCSDACQLNFLFDRSFASVDDFQGSKIEHLLDWPKSDFAACLFGANEPSDRLFTAAHEFVIIDSELMFSTGPCRLEGTRWWNLADGNPSPSGRALAAEVCREFCQLSAADIQGALWIPDGIKVQKKWPIAPKLTASRAFAAKFLQAHG
ncbi:hypothetical protein ACI2TX_21820 [Ralstonia nicotianae]